MKPIRIAFYGKGGIGKSTIASNVSAAFALQGKRVLHIGCDPKADSTRCLTGRRIPSVLEQLALKEAPSRNDLVWKGRFQVQCTEAGGPEAGAGCAGLGITTAMQELERTGVFEENWDVIVYDVLGDVVCGGFSVPMRRHYVDQVYVVTSSDFMALYAANNILKGIRRYSCGSHLLFGGLILNHVKSKTDLSVAQLFAEQTNAHLTEYFLESTAVKRMDFQRELLISACPGDPNSMRFKHLLQKIEDARLQEFPAPQPMEREALELFGQKIYEQGAAHDWF